jgi:hypothetical protein
MVRILWLLVVAVIALLVYKFYLGKTVSPGTSTPTATIDVVGVKNDLLGIAQAERAYQAEHGSYASLDELTSSGALTMKRASRGGYTYDVETSAAGFRAIAHCPSAQGSPCTNYAVDQSMEVQAIP